MTASVTPMLWEHRAKALRGTNVLVLGLGVSGFGVAKVLAEAGAEVYASEQRRPPSEDPEVSELLARGITVELGGHDRAEKWLSEADLVIPSPGIPPDTPILQQALASGAEVLSEIELASRYAFAPIVAVTGTNGKTTTCRMLDAILKRAGVEVTTCGNIGRTFIGAVAAQRATEVFVVETSSFQLAFCETLHPRVAVVTNLAPDHFDWHRSTADYHAAKAKIAQRQTPRDRFVHPAADPRTAELAPSDGPRRITFDGDAEPIGDGAWIEDGELVVRCDGSEHRCGPIGQLASRGRPFVEDALAASAAVFSLAEVTGVGRDDLEEVVGDALRGFAPDHHRVEVVGEAGDVRFVDDSKATNPHATVAALRSFERVVLIAGGRNKGLDLRVLADEAERLRGVIAIGEASDEVVRAFAGSDVAVVRADGMDNAVREAVALAQPGDVVLLSPACTSWDAYANYAERGDDFRRACEAIVAKGQP